MTFFGPSPNCKSLLLSLYLVAMNIQQCEEMHHIMFAKFAKCWNWSNFDRQVSHRSKMKATLILHGSSSNMVFFCSDKRFLDHFRRESVRKGIVTDENLFSLDHLMQYFFGIPNLLMQMRRNHTPFHGFTSQDGIHIQAQQNTTFRIIHNSSFFTQSDLILKRLEIFFDFKFRPIRVRILFVSNEFLFQFLTN